MSLLMMPAALASALAVDSTADAEARQTAARVRASLLTRDWSWTLETPDLWWKIGIGLSRWVEKSPDFDTLVIRLNALAEMAKLAANQRWEFQTFTLPARTRKPERIVGYSPPTVKVPLPAWGKRPNRIGPYVHGMATIFWHHVEDLVSWDTERSPGRALVMVPYWEDGFFEVKEGPFEFRERKKN